MRGDTVVYKPNSLFGRNILKSALEFTMTSNTLKPSLNSQTLFRSFPQSSFLKENVVSFRNYV